MCEQMSIAFEQQPSEPSEYCPGRCQHELSTVEMSEGNTKSECDLSVSSLGHSTWTNCRVWGSCTLRGEA